jgi:hypothetical protein
MSHASNISIPARFSFRPYRARWDYGWGEIIGWADEPKSLAQMMAPPIIGSTVQVSRIRAMGNLLGAGGDRVVVRISSSSTAPKESEGLSGLYGISYGDSIDVEIDRAAIPSHVLLSHESRSTTPDIAGREFDVLTSPIQEDEGYFQRLGPEHVEKNAWAMRDDFFNLSQEDEFVRRFLNRWGIWNYSFDFIRGASLKGSGLRVVFPHLLWEERERLRNALIDSPCAWLSKASPMSFRQVDTRPYFLVERSYCDDAIKATITIDHLANLKFGICKLNTCRKFFERETRQKKVYCSQKCAHTANVRKLRAQQKKAESKREKNATREN